VIAAWAEEYVGLPFADHGRDREGLDCWGLVRLALREQLGIELPSFDVGYEKSTDSGDVARLVDEGRPLIGAARVSDPRPGDIVLLMIRGLPCHVGVYVGGGCMLHARRRTAAVVEDLRSPMWSRRVEGYYRCRG
jgi:cell wall-associated NlpC family hydrolase